MKKSTISQLKQNSTITLMAVASTLSIASVASAETMMVKVTIENLAPDKGLVITPIWVGFHDGSFDLFNTGQSASASLETLAENGITDSISGDFTGSVQGTILGPGIQPNDAHHLTPPSKSTTMTFTVDSEQDRYLSYAAMLVPSNDAFIGNENPMAIEIFDRQGRFKGADVVISGNGIWDAGTEVNDEVPQNTALLGQMMPNVGETEGGVVMQHGGFIPGGNILSAFPKADFKMSSPANYTLARIRVERVGGSRHSRTSPQLDWQ
jgi:hypothetical protein